MKYVTGMGWIAEDGRVLAPHSVRLAGAYDPALTPTPEVIQAAQTLRDFAARHTTDDDHWQIFGLGPVDVLQRQIDQVMRERDQYKAACETADVLRNYERGLG